MRASEDGVELPSDLGFFGVIVVENKDPTLVMFGGLGNVASFIHEIGTRALFLLTGEGEDPRPLQDALSELLLEGRPGTVPLN